MAYPTVLSEYLSPSMAAMIFFTMKKFGFTKLVPACRQEGDFAQEMG
jgi:hypothetical protein